jgi:hypothetical protein
LVLTKKAPHSKVPSHHSNSKAALAGKVPELPISASCYWLYEGAVAPGGDYLHRTFARISTFWWRRAQPFD